MCPYRYNRHVRQFAYTVGIFLACVVPIFGQLQFEVASIKQADVAAHPSDSLYTDRSAGLHVENYPLRSIILCAFDLRDFQLQGGPGWIEGERYDILAKVAQISAVDASEERLSDEQQRDRELFGNDFAHCWPVGSVLVTYHETKELHGIRRPTAGRKRVKAEARSQTGRIRLPRRTWPQPGFADNDAHVCK